MHLFLILRSPAELAEEFQIFQFSTNHHNMQERILTYRTYSIVPKVMLGWHNKNRRSVSSDNFNEHITIVQC